MAIYHPNRSELAFAIEPTQAAPIADMDADGFLVDHLEADPSVMAQSLVEDMTLETSNWDERIELKGVRNCDQLKVKMNWHGSEAEAADGDPVVQTPLMKLLEHCWGGQTLTTSTTCTGGTALVPILDDLTSIDEGVFISFEDQDDPGRCHIRRVLSVNTMTKAVTLDQGLGFTPTAGDPAHGCAITYLDEEVLEDSTVGNRTLCWLLQRSGPETVYRFVGCKANLALNFGRNAPPSIELANMGANFKHETETKTVFTQASHGQAPLVIARDTKMFLQAYGVNTNIERHDAALAVETGVSIVPIDTMTEAESLMEGRAGYTLARAHTYATTTLVPHTNAWEVALQANSFFKLRYYQVAQPGKAWALHFSRVALAETPKFTINAAQASSVKFKGYPDLNNSNASNQKLWKSKIILVQA